MLKKFEKCCKGFYAVYYQMTGENFEEYIEKSEVEWSKNRIRLNALGDKYFLKYEQSMVASDDVFKNAFWHAARVIVLMREVISRKKDWALLTGYMNCLLKQHDVFKVQIDAIFGRKISEIRSNSADKKYTGFAELKVMILSYFEKSCKGERYYPISNFYDRHILDLDRVIEPFRRDFEEKIYSYNPPEFAGIPSAIARWMREDDDFRVRINSLLVMKR
nr:hypothetical protein [uncultured Albidiferax sp.]